MEIRRLLRSLLDRRDLITTTTTAEPPPWSNSHDAERRLRWKVWMRIDFNPNVMFEMVSDSASSLV